jgi:hypothetical protein
MNGIRRLLSGELAPERAIETGALPSSVAGTSSSTGSRAFHLAT